MSVLAEDYRTVQEAATELGVPYFTLHSYIVRNKIPVRKLANMRIVKLSDLKGYTPRKDRQAVRS